MSENGDKEFYRQVATKFIDIAEKNSKQIIENNRLMTEQLNALDEIKISLQSKPCIVKKREEKIHEGWKNSSLKLYRFVIGTLFFILIGVLTAFGLFRHP